MKRIELAIVRALHRPSLAVGQRVQVTRIVTRIGFAEKSGWTEFNTVAIVDTGAPLSLFPFSAWKEINREVLANNVEVGGILDRPDCRFKADLATVTCLITDGFESLGPFPMQALLAHNDRVPALLGLAGSLEKVTLSMALLKNRAFLESD